MKGRAFILIFLFLLLTLCISVSAENQVQNPSFEDDFTSWGTESGWLLSITTDVVYDGNKALHFDGPGDTSAAGVTQSIDFTDVDEITVYTKIEDSGSYPGYAKLEIIALGAGVRNDGTHDWTPLSLDTSGISGYHTVYIRFHSSSGINNVYADMVFTDDSYSPSTISFNPGVTSFNDPEDVQMNAFLGPHNFTEFIYTTRLYGYTYGGWGALTQVEYNESTVMDTVNKSIVADIDSDWYDLPLYIKAVLLEFNKTDYTTTEIAESGAVYYNIEVGNTDGEINLNQTYYTGPENIEVEWNITGYNTTVFNYMIQMTSTLDGDVSSNFWEASGNWNISQYITSENGSAVFDFYSDGYDLPVWVQGELWAQDKSTGTWTKLDNTPAVIYHETLGDASISLNATYDVGDIALITWQAANEDADIIIKFTNLNTSYIHIVEPYIWIPGTQQFEVYFTNDYIGKIKLELIENGVVTAVAYTIVSAPTIPYIEWYNSEIPLGTDAYYRYYTDNSSDTISIYGPEDQLYNLFSAETGHHYLHTTTAGKDAGIWIISLLHDGTTYYNDTMMVTTADAFVRFDGDEFEIGDTIDITYQLSDFTDEIWMFDANNKRVIQFTCTWGVLTPGVVRTVDYPLVDNNKYGHDIVSLISAGHYETGTWKIYIVRNGILSSESDEWDIATVKAATGDPADTSNEMMSIFFSPEGIFLIFTVIITLMGLAVSKHPGGGAACASVGVGFGVFFKVLPPWMLLLTVIAFVALAGVSTAIYIKGK